MASCAVSSLCLIVRLQARAELILPASGPPPLLPLLPGTLFHPPAPTPLSAEVPFSGGLPWTMGRAGPPEHCHFLDRRTHPASLLSNARSSCLMVNPPRAGKLPFLVVAVSPAEGTVPDTYTVDA